tara:strand:- start:35 stop:883 length:849 start_codon:yes stop_codon:yes gene_type:complete
MNFQNLQTSHWVHDLSPFIWKFSGKFENLGPGGIRWYGMSYLLGFLAAYFLLLLYHKSNRSPYDKDQVINLMTFQIIGVLLGGRIGYLFLYQFETIISDPFQVLRVWQGGMASHGGFIGVFIATFWYAKKSSQNIRPIGDIIVSIVPPGLFFGRIANFINGELWGRTTDISFGVLFPKAPDFLLSIARHPSQLYAALLEGLLTFCFVQWRFWKTDVTKRNPGQLSGEFLIVYAIARITNEFFREPDATLLLGMTRGQFYSLFLILAGGIVIFWAKQSAKLKQ